MKSVNIGNVRIGGKAPLVLIAGPCVIESRAACLALARRLTALAKRLDIPFIFKASYDKANRSSIGSFRGPGLERGLDVLKEVKAACGVPVLTDVHDAREAERAAAVVDVLQIPAFLCRQTDLVAAAASTGKPVNVKKGQFLSPRDMVNVIRKIESTGNRRILMTERGSSFGYNDLVVDMRGLPSMRALGYPVIFDATHSVQIPGGAGDRSGGDRSLAPVLARAAVAAGCDGVFLETCVDPDKALCDRDNTLALRGLGRLWGVLRDLDKVVSG